MSGMWDTAKGIEEQGREYYLELAGKEPDNGIAGVLRKLADEERKHYELFDSMEKRTGISPPAPSGIVTDAKQVFAGLSESFNETAALEDAVDMYEKALALEKKSIDYYGEALDKAGEQQQKEMLSFVRGEERKHERIVQSLLDFVRRPREWLENAEFTHLEEY